jgi:ParB family chromosome partitioning protein
VPIEYLRPNPRNPRKNFSDAELEELAASIKERGIIQPVVVRAVRGARDAYEIIAGERRWRAAQLVKLHEVPVVIRPLGDRDALEIALIENVQREDLTALEEAEGYRRLMEEFGHTQEALATAVGKSRSHVANLLRLLNLPPAVQEMMQDGRLSAGHARALITAAEPVALAQQIVARGLSVRAAEEMVQAVKPSSKAKPKPSAPRASRDPDTVALEHDLSSLLGLKVTIEFDGKGGRLSIHYSNVDQLDDVLQRLNQSPRTVN